jgi:hypothetical protein
MGNAKDVQAHFHILMREQNYYCQLCSDEVLAAVEETRRKYRQWILEARKPVR